MSSKIRSWLVWLIPFIVSFGMAFGALICPSSISDAAMQEGPAGDVAGAAGALVVVINLLTGFTIATFAIIVVKLSRRSPPNRIVLRLGLSFVGAVIIGALAVYAEEVSTPAAWLIVLCGPALLAWFCGAGTPLPTSKI